MLRHLIIITSLFIAAQSTCHADIIVRFTFQQGVDIDTVDVKLFDGATPGTVSNFISYMDDGSYGNSFIHRSIPGFVIQGGGFNYDVNNDDFLTSYAPIIEKSVVTNEPGISNLRGTIAMAKLTGQVNSATNSWFFNVFDNSAALDEDNGGFTVFGEVIGDGMTVLDIIEAVPVENVPVTNNSFQEIPLLSYDASGAIPVATSDLVKVVGIEKVLAISSDYNFGNMVSAGTLQAELYIENIGDKDQNIVDLGITDIVEAPFAISDVDCLGSPLLVGERCTFNVSFSPTLINVYKESLSVKFSEVLSGKQIDHTINLSGSAGMFKITPDYYDYGTVTPNSNLQPEFSIENITNQNLLIGDMASSDPLAQPFAIRGDQCSNTLLLPGEKCNFVVVFYPKDSVEFKDSFNIEFPELDYNYQINVTGVGGILKSEPDIVITVASTVGWRSTDLGLISFDDSVPAVTSTIELRYLNIGGEDLNVTSIELDTASTSEFMLSGDCLVTTLLVPFSGCDLFIEFTPSSTGFKSAVINFNSDDPDESVFDYKVSAIVIPASGSVDEDGVDTVIEDLAPNNGDGNYDGILDSTQPNVVSIADSKGQYITLVSIEGVQFQNVRFVNRSEFSDIPNGVGVDVDVIEFTMAGLTTDAQIAVGMILPSRLRPSAFNVFAPVAGNAQVQWFDFDKDEVTSTGTQITTGASFTGANNERVPATFVTLSLRNASRGDSSFDVDNEIKVIGAFVVTKNDDSSGQLHLIELGALFLMIRLFRGNKKTT